MSQLQSQNENSDTAVTPELFREWRSPRFGRSNPERMDNPVWEWLIKSKMNAYLANERFNGPDSLDAGPCWCFERFGQSSTQLPDGRSILIGGEHEDHYDADFYIYNDVIVTHPNGEVNIYGYPRDVFPPIDFHSATLVENRIIVIGSLGYPEDRRFGVTQVFSIEIESFAVSSVLTFGTPPGWIYGHQAVLSAEDSSLLITGGKLHAKDSSLLENIDDWKLDLTSWCWSRLTKRNWQRWKFRRSDGQPNQLWQIQQALWSREMKWEKEFEESMENLTEELGAAPDLDLFPQLYSPNFRHDKVAEADGEYRIFRIKVEGVTVRYVEDMHSVQMTIEGDLPQHVVDLLAADLRKKLSDLENTDYQLRKLENP